MQQTQKFQFDVEFDRSGQILRSPTEINAFSLDEVEKIKAEAWEEGRSSETARAASIAADALTQISQVTAQFTDQLDTEVLKYKKIAMELATVVARKVSEHALKAYPESEIEAIFDECIGDIPAESRLVVFVSGDLTETISQKIDDIARSHGFEGRIRIEPEDGLDAGDCRIEWGTGGIERQVRDIIANIENIIDRRLRSEAAEIGQLDLFAESGATDPAAENSAPGVS